MKNAGATALVLVLGAATFYFWNENRELARELRIMKTEKEQARILDEADIEMSRRKTCLNYLRMIDGAIQQWALEKRKTSEDRPLISDLIEYIPGGFPQCPDGGTYTIKTVADQPRCSIREHVLPQY